MSAPRDEHPAEGIEEVRKAYREAGFDEQPPGHVDARILAVAKRASRRNFNAYLPSLAMAATLLLALGLVLRLTLPGRDVLEPAAVDEPAGDSMRPAAPAQREGAQERAAPLEEAVSAADEAAPAAVNEAAGEGLASSAAERMVLPGPAPVACPQPQREAPDAWLACIAAQIEADALAAAREELAAFRLAYPDYPVPANTTEALEP